MYLSPAILKRLTDKLKKLNGLLPLPETAVRKLKEHFEVEMTYNSNAIEGNSLTLRETFLLMLKLRSSGTNQNSLKHRYTR